MSIIFHGTVAFTSHIQLNNKTYRHYGYLVFKGSYIGAGHV